MVFFGDGELHFHDITHLMRRKNVQGFIRGMVAKDYKQCIIVISLVDYKHHKLCGQTKSALLCINTAIELSEYNHDIRVQRLYNKKLQLLEKLVEIAIVEKNFEEGLKLLDEIKETSSSKDIASIEQRIQIMNLMKILEFFPEVNQECARRNLERVLNCINNIDDLPMKILESIIDIFLQYKAVEEITEFIEKNFKINFNEIMKYFETQHRDITSKQISYLSFQPTREISREINFFNPFSTLQYFANEIYTHREQINRNENQTRNYSYAQSIRESSPERNSSNLFSTIGNIFSEIFTFEEQTERMNVNY